MAKQDPKLAEAVYDAEVTKPKMEEISDKLLKKVEDNDDISRLANRALKNMDKMTPAQANSVASGVLNSVSLPQQDRDDDTVETITQQAISAYGKDDSIN